MNKVDIISSTLYKKIIVDDSMDDIPDSHFKQTKQRKNKSPELTLKRLIKKGLVHYTNPFIRPKSGKHKYLEKQKQNLKSVQMRKTQVYRNQNSSTNFLGTNKCKTSQSVFLCSKNHPTSFKNSSTKYRVRTQQAQPINKNIRSSEFPGQSYSHKTKVLNKNNFDDFMPLSGQVFRQFRNISQQSLSRVNVENERRNLKLSHVKKIRYDQIWSKYPVPPVSKDRHNKKPQGMINKGNNSPFLFEKA